VGNRVGNQSPGVVAWSEVEDVGELMTVHLDDHSLGRSGPVGDLMNRVALSTWNVIAVWRKS
jgi:hypothetical protein